MTPDFFIVVATCIIGISAKNALKPFCVWGGAAFLESKKDIYLKVLPSTFRNDLFHEFLKNTTFFNFEWIYNLRTLNTTQKETASAT